MPSSVLRDLIVLVKDSVSLNFDVLNMNLGTNEVWRRPVVVEGYGGVRS
jgi:hypothetical protein